MIPFICNTQSRQIHRDRRQNGGGQGLGGGEWPFNGYRASFCGDGNVLELVGGDGCTTR